MSRRSLLWMASLGIAIFGFLLYYFITPHFHTTVNSNETVTKSEERNSINGLWKLLQVEGPGIVMHADKGEEIIYEFEDSKLLVTRSKGKEVQTSEETYQLDASKHPKTIEMTMTFFITTTVNGKLIK